MSLKELPVLCQKTVAELCVMLEDGCVTSLEIVEAYLQAISLRNEEINAYLEVYADDARREAAQSDARRKAGKPLGRLDGVPIAVKDNIVMRGRVCSCAGKMLESFCSPYDATVIVRLRAAGMPILGRLNMDEFAMGGSTENSLWPNPQPLGSVARAGRLIRRVGGGGRGGHGSRGAGQRYGRQHPPTRELLRRCRRKARLRRGQPLWAGGVCKLAGSDWPARQNRRGRGPCAGYNLRA